MQNKIKLYCDGGCRGNQFDENIGGWGVYALEENWDIGFYGNAKNTTNNIMELTSCIQGLKFVADKKNSPIEVIMDSQYVVKGMNEWIQGWIKKGWKNSKKELVANKELWIELNNLRNQFTNLTFIQCKGHSDNVGNNKADLLANEAMDELE
jgi:ribonuclease HI